MPSQWGKTLLRWGPAFLWMAAIFFISSQSSLPQAPDTLLDLILKKGLHMAAYGVLAGLLWRALGPRPAPKRVGTAWSLAVLYAVTDEYHQTFVPGRHGRPMDLVFDGLGALIALWLIQRWERRRMSANLPNSGLQKEAPPHSADPSISD